VGEIEASKAYVFKKLISYSGLLFQLNFNLSKRKFFLTGTRIPIRKMTPTLLKLE